MKQPNPRYKRVMLKLSGEALAGKDGILNFDFLDNVAGVIKKCHDAGIEVAVLSGAGNIWRGRSGGAIDSCRADHMGMLATLINAIAIQDALLRAGLKARVLSAVGVDGMVQRFDEESAISALESGEIIVFGAGTGLPFFSTDTAAVVRAAQIKADVVLMAKNIDAVYSDDPRKNPAAVRYSDITYAEVIEKQLKALDLTATIFCMDHQMKCYAFELKDPENILRVVMGENIGTELHN